MKIGDIVRVNLGESRLAFIQDDDRVSDVRIDKFLGRYKIVLTGCDMRFPSTWGLNWLGVDKYDTILKCVSTGLIFFAQIKGCVLVNISGCDQKTCSEIMCSKCYVLEQRIQKLERLHGVVK